MAEDIGNLEARIRQRTNTRASTCSVCDWLADSDDPEFWDRMMALPTKEAGHFAIHEEMLGLGFDKGRKAVESHRNSGHRRGPG
jgi:hypothetical protein